MRRLIYSKQYPKPDIKEPIEDSRNDGDTAPSWEEIEKKLEQRQVTYEDIPFRFENSRKFYNIAVKTSETFEYDIEIYETEDRIEVQISFDSHCTCGALSRLFHMADDFSFIAGIKNREITVIMDYYTVAVYHDGERYMPDNRYYFD